MLLLKIYQLRFNSDEAP